MKHTIIRYRTRPERADDNQRLIEAVFEELRARPIAGIDYQAMRLPDGTFVHMYSQAPEVVGTPLADLPAFKEFTREIAERRFEPAQRDEVILIGHHAGCR